MTWLWRGGEGPKDIPVWAHMYLVNTLNINPDYLSQLKCVEYTDFEGNLLLTLIRIFDPNTVGKGIKIKDFASLDQYPDLILFEGQMEKASGKVHITRGTASGRANKP